MSTDTRAAGAESDRDFVERMEADRALVDITVPGPTEGFCDAEFERLIAISREALRLKAVNSFNERAERLSRRAVTPSAAQASEEDARDAWRCKTPGCCTCALPRCAKCGYTDHDARFHMDHSLCDGVIPMTAEECVSIRADTAAAEHQPVAEPIDAIANKLAEALRMALATDDVDAELWMQDARNALGEFAALKGGAR